MLRHGLPSVAQQHSQYAPVIASTAAEDWARRGRRTEDDILAALADETRRRNDPWAAARIVFGRR